MDELITVVFGGPSPEHEISILTGLQCERVLSGAGKKVQCLYWDKFGTWYHVPAETEARDYLSGAPSTATELTLQCGVDAGWFHKKGLRRAKLPMGTIVNCCHGGLGEGGGAQALFALLGVPATGGSSYSAALGMDKLAFGSLLRDAGVPTLQRELLTADSTPSFDGPYIVKPRFGGSSIGIEVASDVDTARLLVKTSQHLRTGAVVEPFREDLMDLNMSFRTYPTFATSAIERPLRPADSGVYSYDQKYLHSDGLTSAPRELPAKIPAEQEQHMRELARQVADLTGATGIARLDFLARDDELYVNEINTIPGAMSLFLWTDTPAATVLLDAVAEAQAALPTALGAAAGYDQGAALQAAGGIAGKLVGLNRS